MNISAHTFKVRSAIATIVLVAGCLAACATTASPALADLGSWLQWHEVPTLSFNVTPASAGSPTSFHAQAVTPPDQTTVSYRWSFGDGTTVETSAPATTHIYVASGSFTATLTVVFTFQQRVVDQSATPASHTVAVPSLPPPPPPPLAPVHLPSGPVTITPHGYAFIPLVCPKTAVQGCHGTITLKLAPRSSRRHPRADVSRCARGCRALGGASYQARAGQRIRVRVHIASFDRRLLARLRTQRVQVIATSVSGTRSARSVATLTLKARRHSHHH
jgi:PKD domain